MPGVIKIYGGNLPQNKALKLSAEAGHPRSQHYFNRTKWKVTYVNTFHTALIYHFAVCYIFTVESMSGTMNLNRMLHHSFSPEMSVEKNLKEKTLIF